MKNISDGYDRLSGDSGFVECNVARITRSDFHRDDFEELLAYLKAKKFKLVYWFIDPSNQITNNIAKTSGGLLVDEKVTFLTKIPKHVEFDKNKLVSYINKPVTKQLLSLAFQSGEYSRYRIDKHFAEDIYRQMYTIWIQRSVNREIAEEVLVYTIDGIEAGFITLGTKNNHAEIGLLAVDEKFRGKSIGKQLVNAAFAKAKDLGYLEMQVVTQKKNSNACNFYKKIGFQIDSIENIYHFWL